MSTLLGCAVILLAALIVVLLVALPARDAPLLTGRAARIRRIGWLWAGLSASYVGARVRRIVAGPQARARLQESERRAAAERVTREMGQMKGALMKLGQMLSFISDDVPVEFREALASLQTSAPEMEFPLIRDVLERELGRPLERAFASFEEKPLASASIGQVHRATLPDGREVAVKVQYPGVGDAIRADLANAGLLYSMLGMFYKELDPKPVVDELRARIFEELDYRHEADSQRAFAECFDGHPFIGVPRVVYEYSTPLVLSSEYVDGRRFAEITALGQAERSRYGEILYRFVFGSIFRLGVFNGDPHPGNYLFDAAGRMVFVDFGCVKYFPLPMLDRWKRVLRAHLSGDPKRFRELIVEFGFLRADSDIDAERLYRYFGYFYEPFRIDRSFRFSRDYTQKSFRMVFNPTGEFEGFEKKLNMPRDFVFVNRVQWGVYSVLADLEAEANYHRIHREYVFDDPPSTELGERDAEFRARWRAAHGLSEGELLLTPSGVKPREAA